MAAEMIQPNAGSRAQVDPLTAAGRIGFQRIESRNPRDLRVGPSFTAARTYSRFSAARITPKAGVRAQLQVYRGFARQPASRAGQPRLLESWKGMRVDRYA
jgi:hypothetical protein